jgi:hypothetical protein
VKSAVGTVSSSTPLSFVGDVGLDLGGPSSRTSCGSTAASTTPPPTSRPTARSTGRSPIRWRWAASRLGPTATRSRS